MCIRDREKGYQDESYWDGLLEYPQFTRPEVWEGRAVPPVLLTGCLLYTSRCV